MKHTFYSLVIILIFAGCSVDPDTFPPLSCEVNNPEKINVRILNMSSFEIVDFNYDNIQTFNSILPGETTAYMELENSWDVPSYREMTIEGKEFALQLIDPLGLSILESGCYTYLLHAFEYGDGEIYSEGRIYPDDILVDFDPIDNICEELDKSDCNPNEAKVNIRIKNSTAFDFCNVEVDMNSQDHFIYGSIASGETSCYISLDLAKKYPLSCKFFLGGEEFLISTPSYFENLDPLSSGFYTYNIYLIDPSTQFATIQMSND